MSKRTVWSACGVILLGLVSSMAMAAPGRTVLVEFQGPGGHSNGNYGRTSAVHAAARSIIRLQDTDVASGTWWLSGFNGGNSVNSIASDARFTVHLTATSDADYKALVKKITAAVNAGVSAENAFRHVDKGDRVDAGARADIRYTITVRTATKHDT
ncbi:MAG TPA: peptidase dimerization domain-containing protein [Oleiagrimonas sp.]|nr:peptidase dimerization domain-containing protein [Oleiagrimonas sp.]